MKFNRKNREEVLNYVLAKCKNPIVKDAIDEIYWEGPAECEGYWCYLKEHYVLGGKIYPALHTIHEGSIRDIIHYLDLVSYDPNDVM